MNLPNRNSNPGHQNSSLPEWRVPLSAPFWSEAEIQAVVDVLRGGWWTSGPIVRRLESEFASLIGARHALAVANGTASLQLAYQALGIETGDEVLIPSLNFVAGANAILHAGGLPRFVDVRAPDTPLVCAETLQRQLSPKTRGICVMHYGGYPCAMDEIMDFAQHHGLWIVEDAAHAPGAAWKGNACGCWGDIACFSFFGNKNITCAEGGMVVTQRDDLADKMRVLRSHGMDLLTWDRYHGHQFTYNVESAGFNYRLDDLRAAILRTQMESLDRINHLRKERVSWYREMLGSDGRWTIPFINHQGVSSHHLMVVVLNEGIDRHRLMAQMRSQGIQTSVHYPPIHEFTFYRNLLPASADLKITESLGRRLLTFPLFPGMTREQVNLVCESFLTALNNAT